MQCARYTVFTRETAIKEYFQQGVVNRIPGDTDVFVAAPKRQAEFEYGKERLIEEARIVAKFQSPSIVRVDDFFEENGTSYMVMEFLDYETMEDFLIHQKRPLTEDEAVNIGVRLCEALDEIHHAGVIHRDISPDNIFVGKDGSVKIIDFGSARLSKEDTDSRLIVLKPGYAPPEQYEKIDPENDLQQAWTDIYALGATTLSTDPEPGNLNGFPALSIFLKGFGVIDFFIVLQDSELNLQNIHPNYL